MLSAPSSPRSRAGPSTMVVGCQCFFQCRHSRVAQAFDNGFGGGVTGLVNCFLGISGPLSSAVFLTLELAPVSYIASEATTAAESVVR